jgi:predicted AAA+ superfamily ATPase
MLRDIVLTQKTELENQLKENYIQRDTQTFSLQHNLIKVITGPRRAGKSFFVIHTLKETENFGYANFDHEELATTENYDDLISEINQVYNQPKILFFDEIQNLPKWELFVNRLQRQGYNIIITGSNSKLLSKELATHLTGRHIPTTIFTFSYKEYLKAKNTNPQNLTTQQKEELLLNYIQNGGYPETITKNINPKQYLTLLFDATIYKDIIKRHNIRKGPDIERLATYLLANLATETSYLALSKATNIKSSITTQKYCNLLEEAYLIFSITRFSYKTKQPTQNRKFYCYDNGIITAKTPQHSPNTGKLFENCIATHLKREETNKKIELYYWRNQQGQEVDFVIKKQTKTSELIQACYDTTNKKTQQRETRALLKAATELQCNKLTILTLKEEKTQKTKWHKKEYTITYTPLQKWLLNTTTPQN